MRWRGVAWLWPQTIGRGARYGGSGRGARYGGSCRLTPLLGVSHYTDGLERALRAASSPVALLDILDSQAQIWRSVSYRASAEEPSQEQVFRDTGIRGSDLLQSDSASILSELRDITTALFVGSALCAIAANKYLGQPGVLISYAFSVLPILFVAVGSTAPSLITDSLATLKGRDESERILRHEAAHLVAGYLCGLPIIRYQLDGAPQIEFQDDGIRNRDAIETLAAVALAGAVAECYYFGSAKGVQGDLKALQRILDNADPPYTPEQQRAATRRAVLNAYSLLFDRDEPQERRGLLVTTVEAVMRDPDADLPKVLATLERTAATL